MNNKAYSFRRHEKHIPNYTHFTDKSQYGNIKLICMFFCAKCSMPENRRNCKSEKINDLTR